jgi:hypothetical protein
VLTSEFLSWCGLSRRHPFWRTLSLGLGTAMT